MTLRLEKIDRETLQDYQKLYKKEWPKYCQEFYTLDNFIRYLKGDPQMAVKVFTLSDQRAKDAALFVIVDRYQLIVGCLDNTYGLMKKALTLLDWSTGFKCSFIPGRHIPDLDSVVEEKQLRVEWSNNTDVYYMPKELAKELKVDLPDGFYIDSLREEDAGLIDSMWPNRHVGSLFFIRRQIRLNLNVGLYSADNRQLVGWCIRDQGGNIGALQVRESHKRRGLGTVVAKALARRIGASGQDAIAMVNPLNAPSVGVFRKLGFKAIDECRWMRTAPIAGEFHWPVGE